MDGGIEPGFLEQARPMVVRFLVELARVAGARLVDGGVKALRREFPPLDDQLPRPLDRFLFEVIAEAPVAEHLEERVVIRVEPDVIEVVMFAAGADAFLRVGCARRAATGALCWPRKMGTNWFMPALVKRRFGASGSSDD